MRCSLLVHSPNRDERDVLEGEVADVALHGGGLPLRLDVAADGRSAAVFSSNQRLSVYPLVSEKTCEADIPLTFDAVRSKEIDWYDLIVAIPSSGKWDPLAHLYCAPHRLALSRTLSGKASCLVEGMAVVYLPLANSDRLGTTPSSIIAIVLGQTHVYISVATGASRSLFAYVLSSLELQFNVPLPQGLFIENASRSSAMAQFLETAAIVAVHPKGRDHLTDRIIVFHGPDEAHILGG